VVHAAGNSGLVDYGRGAFLTGVYRTDSSSDGPELPTWCLGRSEWIRETDLERSRRAAEPSEYLTSGPQVTNRLVFANRATQPGIEAAMTRVLSALGSGITVCPRSSPEAPSGSTSTLT
jgi:hypothetical protein